MNVGKHRWGDSGGAGDFGPWRLLLILAAAVAVPTACVLYFTNQAMRNARLAARQRLVDAYEPPLNEAAAEIVDFWQQKADALSGLAADAPPPQRFAKLACSGVCDGLVIYDEEGEPAYPFQPQPAPPDSGEPHPFWIQPRALTEAGDTAGAVELLAALFADQEQAEVRDSAGRLVAPLAALRAMELLNGPEDGQYGELRAASADRLNDYGPPAMPSAQRRFLMRRLQEMPGDPIEFPTLWAEELTAEYLTHAQSAPRELELTQSAVPGVWRMTSEDGRVVALFRADGFMDQMETTATQGAALPGTAVCLQYPGGREADDAAFIALPLGSLLPGWRLALHLEGEDPFAAAAEQEVAGYLWASLLGVGAIGLLALVGGRLLLRQARLTRLKNDFIATVTHELKTPLSSIRMFAETLREGRYESGEQADRYLHLLVKENERLCRLIDNFLGFSRMERDKRAFEMAELSPGEVAREAADSVAERFRAAGCEFEADIQDPLPPVWGDRDALVTVLLNLLDNAYKYTGEEKSIALRAMAVDGQVRFEVEDNGIGMSRAEARRSFERFYQADGRLSRRAEGCGLGLSIVRFIVDAHGGTVDVESEPGRGSTFAVTLPSATAGE